MAIVGMSGKNASREKVSEPETILNEAAAGIAKCRAGIIREDSTWYNPSLCNGDRRKCPYLEMNDATQMAMCHKPYAESCLGQSMLVQTSLLREHYLKITKKLDEIDAKATADLICGAGDNHQKSKKKFVSRIRKPLKRRR